jgi:hypothetical protein
MSVTIIDFLLLEHDANVPLEYAAFLTQDCWNGIKNFSFSISFISKYYTTVILVTK